MNALRLGLVGTLALGALAFTDASGNTVLAAGNAKDGDVLYHTYCRACHGPRMTNVGGDAYDLRKFPLSQKRRFVKAVKEGKKGKVEMPAWGDILTTEEIDHIWAYVKTRGK